MLTYPKSTMRVQRMPMHLSSGHVTLMQGKFYPPLIFSQSDLGRRADSRWALPQISSCFRVRSSCRSHCSSRSLKVLDFFQIFKAWKIFENRHVFLKILESVSEDTWKCLNFIFWNAVIEQVIFRISVARVWMANRLFHYCFSDNSKFWLMLEGVKLNVNWTCLCMLIKVPVWYNSVLLIYLSYGFWKSLNLILTNGQEPWGQ